MNEQRRSLMEREIGFSSRQREHKWDSISSSLCQSLPKIGHNSICRKRNSQSGSSCATSFLRSDSSLLLRNIGIYIETVPWVRSKWSRQEYHGDHQVGWVSTDTSTHSTQHQHQHKRQQQGAKAKATAGT
ncbi:hypothetical protein M0802_002422 [Mischocyttarus mexicanus]|nr:hypothetical protein M0802_002422 [Mischocyttarus mexicanus]